MRTYLLSLAAGPLVGALSEGIRGSFWLLGMMGGLKGQLDCIREFSEVDDAEDLKRIDRPTLIVHVEDDRIVPIGASAMPSPGSSPRAVLEVNEGVPHGLVQPHQDRRNADLLAFLQE